MPYSNPIRHIDISDMNIDYVGCVIDTKRVLSSKVSSNNR